MKALQGSFFAASTEFGKPENRKNPKLGGLNTQPLPNQKQISHLQAMEKHDTQRREFTAKKNPPKKLTVRPPWKVTQNPNRKGKGLCFSTIFLGRGAQLQGCRYLPMINPKLNLFRGIYHCQPSLPSSCQGDFYYVCFQVYLKSDPWTLSWCPEMSANSRK